MIRALLFAFGLSGTLIGAGLFYVDSIALKPTVKGIDAPFVDLLMSVGESGEIVIRPAAWLPYTLVGMSALTVLYSIALPPRRRHEHYGRGHHHH
ncbi:hypothetical protein [Planctomyces sp. SH-PL14]|uniref:hypothetical protein n=1 Tax=Planctomyces sp. SH-PL14 TaxID=1632864 RepID=UPI00078EB89E|nr:hypothetical protein [Planctomyces sp. SH-PL14]AMV17562.1 hypothetical protein VT03_06695 [Planctomyces sp. SH-PL14]